jgi:hypothetical protein
MGTRSLTYVYDDNNDPIICMYRQFDGYPTGHGSELAHFLLPFKIVNGISGGAEMGKVANGMGCLAAQLVGYFKTDVGNIYLYSPRLKIDAMQEYEYHVTENTVTVKLIGYDEPNKVIFEGSYGEFFDFCREKVES